MKLLRVPCTISDRQMASLRRRAEEAQRRSGRNWLTDPAEIRRRRISLASHAKRQAN